MVVDFFHVDSFEYHEYESIRKNLGDRAKAVLFRPSGPVQWFDYEDARGLYETEGAIFQNHPSRFADGVITTQYHRVIHLPEYRNAVSFRLAYFLGSEKKFAHAPRAVIPFDSVLVPGLWSYMRLKKMTVPLIVGRPKYDKYFSGAYDRPSIQKRYGLDLSKPTLLYLPTWGRESSLADEEFKKNLLSLEREYNIFFKPHHVTLRFEKEKLQGWEGVIFAVGHENLGELFSVGDIMICDALSGAFWESIFVALKPTLGVFRESGVVLTNMEKRIGDYGIINRNSGSLRKDIERSREYFEKNRARFLEERREFLSYIDGTAGKKAAEEILNFIELYKVRRDLKTVHFLKWHCCGGYGADTHPIWHTLKQLLKKIIHMIGRRFVRGAFSRLRIISAGRILPREKSWKKALDWVKKEKLQTGGVPVSSEKRISYPEVTGYFIPALRQWGEKNLALELARWLISVQNPDGSFSASDGKAYTFDTGQAVRGFLSVLKDVPEVRDPLKKACDWIVKQQMPEGRLTTPSTELWGNIADERIHLYVLPPLLEAGRVLGISKYMEGAERALAYYKKRGDLTEFNTLSHFFGYIIEALADLGEKELALKGLEQVMSLQKRDGAVPAYKNVSWVCVPGVAQFAVIGYKLGKMEFADRAVSYLEQVQNSSGGFLGSRGLHADYFPNEEISWAVKFFLDAYSLKIKSSFDAEISQFPETIEENDGRIQSILSFLGDIKPKRIIDIGCGKGRFLRVLKNKFPDAELYGIDISDEMLKHCPEGVKIKCAGVSDTGFPDNYFDAVYSVETLEHAFNAETALKEMIRILEPGGKLMIIDKNAVKLGKMDIKPWEQWFDRKTIEGLLKPYCLDIKSQFITYGSLKEPDGLFISWQGIKK